MSASTTFLLWYTISIKKIGDLLIIFVRSNETSGPIWCESLKSDHSDYIIGLLVVVYLRGSAKPWGNGRQSGLIQGNGGHV